MSITLQQLHGTGGEVILASLLGTLSAQVLKVIWYSLQRKPVSFRTLVETGGMPSSHSSAMTSMATGVGLICGWNSVAFAIALNISMVVMYDAAGVRRAAGRMAGILNRMTADIYTHHPDKVPERLRELLGHTPVEVLAGGLLGITVAVGFHRYLNHL